ncbi:hypothetical protein JOC85_001024 [Bacillus mesophilus]|nr:hypothetical protein [Bacillus mesophilus]
MKGIETFLQEVSFQYEPVSYKGGHDHNHLSWIHKRI